MFSFLEFALPEHWSVFERTIEAQKRDCLPHLDTFVERNVIEIWAKRLNFASVEFIDGTDKKFNGESLWQSIAILRP